MTDIQHYGAPTLALSQGRTEAPDAGVHSLVFFLATGKHYSSTAEHLLPHVSGTDGVGA
jgi:hypothetical protein